ncbi:Cysteine proteinase inhibitor 10 [Euphorbia peplus]|nr:Cysteine proteinase inhibitor 10 [Euphorbia peplus]
MAKSATSILLLVLSAILSLSPAATAFAGKVGGRTEVTDVKNNKEVQELGRFSIHEFNKILIRHGGNDRQQLMFSKVVEAEKQVVSGVKYYMKIEATNRAGEKRFYHSVVVVKPWMKSKELVKFEPAATIELRRFKK